MSQNICFFLSLPLDPIPIPTDSGCVTYESVLLNNVNHSNITSTTTTTTSPIIIHHKTTSYAQIDAMLDKMLFEVEKQEKLFTLDLVDDDADSDSCVNSLELQPSTDALIEIPIKKSIRVPKVYETTHQIVLLEDAPTETPYEFVQFGDSNLEKSNNKEDDYELMALEVDSTSESLNQLQESVNKMLENVQQDEVEILLLSNENLQTDSYKSPIFFYNTHTASSESLSDVSVDDNNWNDYDYVGDYEPIDSSIVLSNYPYELYGNNTDEKHAHFNKDFHTNRSDIWWEGTYRNLSVVPEEDEENLSLIGTHSNKSYDNSKQKIESNDSNRSSYFSAKDESCSSDTTTLSSSNNSEYVSEKIVKAEVKLLVKTLDKGKEAIEIRSVREFMEEPKRDSNKSQTLPIKFNCEQIGNEIKKRGSEPCLMNYDDKSTSPSYTLQSVFIHKPDYEDTSNCKTRSGLISLPTNNYPLQYGNAGYEPMNIDLFANAPFYPLYSTSENYPSTSTSPPNTMIIPEGYCDWIQEFGISSRGNVIILL